MADADAGAIGGGSDHPPDRPHACSTRPPCTAAWTGNRMVLARAALESRPKCRSSYASSLAVASAALSPALVWRHSASRSAAGASLSQRRWSTTLLRGSPSSASCSSDCPSYRLRCPAEYVRPDLSRSARVFMATRGPPFRLPGESEPGLTQPCGSPWLRRSGSASRPWPAPLQASGGASVRNPPGQALWPRSRACRSA